MRLPIEGELHIGYGIAPTRRRRGLAARAVRDLVAWASSDSRIDRITAETALDNPPSQRVLEGSGFLVTGSRKDPEDGDLLTWERRV
ncbi:MAG: GNAT family N-acetyltransferase [Rhodanobacter sp.]